MKVIAATSKNVTNAVRGIVLSPPNELVAER